MAIYQNLLIKIGKEDATPQTNSHIYVDLWLGFSTVRSEPLRTTGPLDMTLKSDIIENVETLHQDPSSLNLSP
jgi:hypothetical protein